MLITGECFCSAVRYQIKGKLSSPRSCHCSRCRKVFGGAASAYAIVDPNEFSWVAGEEFLTTFINREQIGMRFCSRCGSTLCGTYQGHIHGITLGTLNETPDIGAITHIYVASRAKWESLPDDIIQYAKAPPELIEP